MATGLGQDLKITLREPRGPLRAGIAVDIIVDVTLAEPWFSLADLGQTIGSIDGRSVGDHTCYESRGSQPIPAPFAGTLRVEDTRLDVHTPSGFPDAGSGQGVVATLSHPAGFELRFGHLQRGSTPAKSRVSAGELIGRTGNTGRCVDGCGRAFVQVAFKAPRSRRLSSYDQPLRLRATLGDQVVTRPLVKIPAGQTQLTRLKLGRAKAERRPGKKTTPLTIELVQGTQAHAVARFETELRVEL